MMATIKAKRRKLLTALSAGALFIALVLLYEKLVGTFQWSHAYLMLGVLFCAVVVTMTRARRLVAWIKDLAGLDTESPPVWLTGFFGGMLLSLYLLLGDLSKTVPPALQFSIIPVTATLGGLVIAGANYRDITGDRRRELLGVAQKLITATLCFIFFAVFYSLAVTGGYPDPNHWPSGSVETTKWAFLWLGVVLYFLGASLFVIGVIDLVLGLKRLKTDASTPDNQQ